MLLGCPGSQVHTQGTFALVRERLWTPERGPSGYRACAEEPQADLRRGVGPYISLVATQAAQHLTYLGSESEWKPLAGAQDTVDVVKGPGQVVQGLL